MKPTFLTTPHFDRHTSYVAMSRHKQQAKLYASKNDFKNKNHLYRTLGKKSEKLSALDFVDLKRRQHEQYHKPPLKERLKQTWQRFVLRTPKDMPAPPKHVTIAERNRVLAQAQQRQKAAQPMRQNELC